MDRGNDRRPNFRIYCSNCGHKSRVYSYRFGAEWRVPKEITEAGWDSCGDAFYCPQCVRSWDERNPGRELNGYDCTIVLILEKMVRELKDTIDAMNGKEEW